MVKSKRTSCVPSPTSALLFLGNLVMLNVQMMGYALLAPPECSNQDHSPMNILVGMVLKMPAPVHEKEGRVSDQQ